MSDGSTTTDSPMRWHKLLSQNRKRPSRSSPLRGRSAFDLDYDRVLFSTPVRRLQDKAQVFPLEPNDAVRTRLTHSLEVSTVARSMAAQAFATIAEDADIPPDLKPTDDQARDIQVVAATCGLIHDLGNPPFGHSGEVAISSWFLEHPDALSDDALSEAHRSDFCKFEGNAQTLRLASHLQVQSDRNGLNFTYGTLSASLKYVVPSNEADSASPNKAHTKPGYFQSELDVISLIRTATGTGSSRHPITYLVEAADDAVYSACDLEDAIRKGILTPGDVFKHLYSHSGWSAELERSLRDAYVRYGGNRDDAGIDGTALRIAIHSIAIPQLVDAYVDHFNLIMNGSFRGALEDFSPVIAACKHVGSGYVYGSGSNPELELLGRRVVHDLMDLFWEGVRSAKPTKKTRTFAQKIMSRISANYTEYMFDAIRELQHPERYCRLQLLTDFICGMTDTFARDLHRRLFNG